jgi:hypothetical protein
MRVPSALKTSTLGVAALFAMSMAMIGVSYADTFTFTSCHVTGGCGTATSFGSVTLTQVGTSVNFDVVLFDGNRFVETGSADQQLFKFNGAASVANITNPLTGMPANAVTGGLQGATGSFNGDGTGNFSFGIECAISANCNGGSTPTFREITFTVTNSTIAALTLANNLGNIFVADVLIGENGLTGPIDVTAIPLPGALPLFITGLAGLGLLGWRRKKQAAASAA